MYIKLIQLLDCSKYDDTSEVIVEEIVVEKEIYVRVDTIVMFAPRTKSSNDFTLVEGEMVLRFGSNLTPMVVKITQDELIQKLLLSEDIENI